MADAERENVETQIALLSELESGKVVSQQSLAKRIAVSVGLINALMKRAIAKGFVKARSAPYKRYAYYLTPRGFSEKTRLVAKYLEVSLNFFRSAKLDYAACFNEARAAGRRRIVLVGAGELAEIATLASHEVDVEIVAVLERGANASSSAGRPLARSIEELPPFDALAVTCQQNPQASYDAAVDIIGADGVFAPEFLRIAKQPPAAEEDASTAPGDGVVDAA